ncbi:hypothetical protein HUX88_12490 [Duganella sp. BJB1802]|uniref:hypothetical protein n=1 Tax=Duganella sp. BJB1802 TaxID=2744575 RepID=UPI001592EEA1|nr:hypothetical protein [Duganella sp. BJB1802]NVD71366.1 hypothetical protein [Duganella sp. BJB1802]
MRSRHGIAPAGDGGPARHPGVERAGASLAVELLNDGHRPASAATTGAGIGLLMWPSAGLRHL